MKYQNTLSTHPLGNSLKLFGLYLLITSLTGISEVVGQEHTGQIIIDGQVYGGDNDTKMIKGNGVKGKDKRSVANFHTIKVLGGIDVNFQIFDNVNVEVTGDQNLLPIISTKVDNGVLSISSNKSYQTNLPLVVELSASELRDVVLEGSGDINLKGLREKSLNLNISGSGNLNADGHADKLAVRISGAGDVDAQKLTCVQADLNITGSGNISVNVKDTLNASIIGSGDITYFGHPKKVSPQILGSGDIEAGD